MNTYWIKRVDELHKENEQLKQKLAEMGATCIHFDGKECRNGENRRAGQDCEFCSNFEVNI